MVLLRHHRTVILSLVAALLLAIIWQWQYLPSANAATVDDAYVTAVSFSSDSTVLAATGVTYTINFTLSESVAADSTINVDVVSSTGCAENWELCQPDFSGGAVSGVDAAASLDARTIIFTATSTLTAGSYTATVTNVSNPTAATALRAYVSTGASDESAAEDYSPDVWYTTSSSTAINIGTALVSGTVTAGGATIANQWVEMHDENWSISRGANTDDKGYYAIFSDYDGADRWTAGSYAVVVYPGEGSGYLTTAADVTYSGSSLSQDIALSEAQYFFSGSVTYSDEDSTTVSVQAGTPVTNANVCFNNDAGNGNYCDTTNELGDYTVAVNQGEYSAYISADVDWSDPAQVAEVDWRFNGNDDRYDINEVGTTTVDFEVDPTTAYLSGTVTASDGSEAVDGSINLTNDEDNYWGSVSDGSYVLNLNPGTYKLSFSPDTRQDSTWGRYSYSDTVTIVEGDNTFDFTLEVLTAQIQVTVTDQLGEPLEGVNVNAWSEQHSSGGETDSAGSATVYVQSDTWYEVSVWSETYLSTDPNQRIKVADGASESVSFAMQQPDATIMATFVDSDGNVVESLHGWFGCNTDDYSQQFGTDLRNGTVELGVVVDETTGEFDGRCSAWFPNDDNGAVTPQDVSVTENETASLEFTFLPLNATIRTFVKDFSTGKKIAADPSINVNLWNQSDDMGHFAQLDDNPVEIPVVADKAYSGGIWSESQQYTSLWSMNNETIKAGAGETETLVLNVLKNDGIVRINAKDPNGDPVEHGWAWCGNWGEVDFALDTVDTNVAIESGAEIRDGEAQISLVAGHSYRCGVGAGKEFVEDGWLSPPEQEIQYSSKNDVLDELTFQFTEADARLTGSVELGASISGLSSADELDSIWCWAWSEGGSSWAEVDPGEDYRLSISTNHDHWTAGCDAVAGEDWYFTEEPYEFSPETGNNTHDFTLQKMTGWKVYEAVSETFDTSENKVITYGDGTRLTIPSGTLAASGNVTVRGTPETSIIRTDVNPLTIPVDWEALDSSGNLIETFPGGSVTIEIPYTDESLAELGIEEAALVGKYWDELSATWKQPDNVSIDKINNIVTITTDHFTQYGVTYNARVSSVRKPKTPQLTVTTSGKHNVRLALRTKKTSPKATRFVVQVRKLGTSSKAQWKTSTFRNADRKTRLKRSVQKLQRSKQYEVRAKACNGAGCSEQSNWQNFATE